MTGDETTGSDPRPERPRSIFGQARELVRGFVRLARLEFERGRQEIGAMLAEAKRGAALIGVAAGIAFLALITLDIVIVMGIAALFEVIPDLAVMIIIVATFTAVAIAFVFLGIGNVVTETGSRILLVVALLVVVAALAVPAYFGFSPPWMAALYVLLVELAFVGLFAARGIQHIKIGPPEETIEAVKEDVAWAKRLLRRG